MKLNTKYESGRRLQVSKVTQSYVHSHDFHEFRFHFNEHWGIIWILSKLNLLYRLLLKIVGYLLTLGNTQCPKLFSVTSGFLFVFGLGIFFLTKVNSVAWYIYISYMKKRRNYGRVISSVYLTKPLLNTYLRAAVSYCWLYKGEKIRPSPCLQAC